MGSAYARGTENRSSPSRDRIVRVARSQPGLFWLLPKLPLTAPSAREAYRPGFRDKAIEHILAMGNSQQRVLPPLNYGFRVWRPTRAFCVLMLRYGGGQKITIIRVRCFRTIAAIGTEDML